jgi:hypothetical protein
VIRLTGTLVRSNGAVATATTDATLTIAQLKAGIIIATPGAAVAYTVPAATDLTAAFPLANDESFDVRIINIATNATYIITITASTGTTVVGSVVIPSNSSTTGGVWGGSSATLRFHRTDATNWICYRA